MEAFFEAWGREVLRVLVPGAHVMVASNPLVYHIVAYALSRVGFEPRGSIVRQVMTMRGGDRPKIECGCTGAELASRVFPKVFNGHIVEVELSEYHGGSVVSGLGFIVHPIDKNTHPLVACAEGVHSAPSFPGTFDFDALLTGLDSIIGIDPMNDKVGMPVVVGILC